jgi:hypothetical protein
MESATSCVPVEIWHYILSLALKANQISDGDYDTQELIKTAKKYERIRTTLRSVCQAWRDHIEKDPMFVNVASTLHGRPAESMPLTYARRSKVVSLEDSFDEFSSWGLHSNDLQNSLGKIIEAGAELRVLNILMYVQILYSHLHTQDHLRNGGPLNFDPEHHFSCDRPALIHLTHLRLVNYTSPAERAALYRHTVVLPQLQVLEYLHERLQFLNFSKWDLPSLIHLRIGWIGKVRAWRNTLNALMRFGKPLKSLALHNSKDGIDCRIDISSTLWELCPKLEQLSCRFGTAEITNGPPAGHPIKHLIIENRNSDGVERAARNLQLIGANTNRSLWPSLQRVTYSQFTWHDLLCDGPVHSTKQQEASGCVTPRSARKACGPWVLLEAEVPLFDSNGDMLQERYRDCHIGRVVALQSHLRT